MDISKECVDVFTWRRVTAMSREDEIAFVRRSASQKRWFKPPSVLKEEQFIKDKVILDAGCGPGLRACILANYGPKLVIGIDGSDPSIVNAKDIASALRLENTLFIQGYLENIPELLKQANVATVDLIVCNQVIHHVSNFSEILKIFFAALPKGGILIVSWLDASSNWGQYMIKNKIAFHLGRSKESRIRIGAFLFGWLDRRKKKLPLEWESFYADRYAAFYEWITVRQMINTLRQIGFEILESYPCLDSKEWRRQELQKPPAQQNRLFLRLSVFPGFQRIFTFMLRVRQFMGVGGDVRGLYCRK